MDWNMKLFEEIARSLRLVKGVHQPEVFEPETPASAPVFEIIVPSDAAAQQAGCSPELRDTIRVIRRDVLATLRQVPAFPHGQFVENVDLIRLPPDIAGAIAGIAIQAALAEISAKLDVVATAVDNLAELVRVANLGALQGAIDALEIARQLRDADRRRKQMLDACNEVVV